LLIFKKFEINKELDKVDFFDLRDRLEELIC